MRTPNIRDIDIYRRKSHNPLFDKLTNEFDYLIREKSLPEKYILENLYVDNRTRERIVRENLYHLWTNPVRDVISSRVLYTDFQSEECGLVYLLLGKKGTGKTITLKRVFLDIKEKSKNEDNVNIIYLDLISKRRDDFFLNSLPNSLIEEIYDIIKDDEHKKNIGNLTDYLSVPQYRKELDTDYQLYDDAEIARKVSGNKLKAILDIFRLSERLRYKTYLIVDNIDDFPKGAIEVIIDKCRELMERYKLKCIIALRDYWNPQSLRLDDRQICSYYLTKPDIFEILKKRLNLIPIDNIKDGCIIQYKKHSIELYAKDIIDMFHTIIKNIMSKKEIHDKLYRLANYDTREHLQNIYYFFHSPYLFSKPMFIQVVIEKIEEVDTEYLGGEVRPTQFFDFIECAMAIHALCYDEKDSRIFNIFFHKHEYQDKGDYNYRNTLIFIRILQSLKREVEDKERIIESLKLIGYKEEALRRAINTLLEKTLIESVQGVLEEFAKEISISEKGKIYLEELIFEYTYLLFVCDAVPMPDDKKENIIDKFGDDELPLNRGTLTIKNESVRKFIHFIRDEEENEEDNCPKEYLGVLSRIRGENGIWSPMMDNVEQIISKMSRGKDNRYTQKSEYPKISITEKKRNV